MIKASELRKGAVVRFRGQVCTVRNLQVQLPSSRGSATLYKLRLRDVRTGQNMDQTFRGDDSFEPVDFSRREASYSYFDGELYVFMDAEDYTQYLLGEEDLREELPFLSEELEGIHVLLVEDEPIGIQLPSTVTRTIEDTAPAMRGATVTKRTKPARLEGGLEIQVPEYVAPGEKVRVNTETGEFVGRA